MTITFFVDLIPTRTHCTSVKHSYLVLFVSREGIILSTNRSPDAGGIDIQGHSLLQHTDDLHCNRIEKTIQEAIDTGEVIDTCCWWNCHPIGLPGEWCWDLTVTGASAGDARYAVIVGELRGQRPVSCPRSVQVLLAEIGLVLLPLLGSA